MNASRSKRLLTLTLMAIFVVSVVPVHGSEPVARKSSEFDLQLADALSVLDDELTTLDLEPTTSPAAPIAVESLQLASLGVDDVALSEPDGPAVLTQTSTSPPASSRAWWKKKKWWIPLVAIAVASVALSGGDGDDNLDDEED